MSVRSSAVVGSVLLALACAGRVSAADPVPEVPRATYPPQGVGQAHTIRIIPEACVYLQGEFTSMSDRPYRWFAARSGGKRCQPRAGFVDAEKAKPTLASGWKLNDVIRIPSAACPSMQAVVRVWRRPVNTPVPLDGRGEPRIYLNEAKRQAEAGKLPPVTVYAAIMSIEGRTCD